MAKRKQMKKSSKSSPIRKIGKILLILVGIIVAAVVLLFALLAITEYKPGEKDPIVVYNSGTAEEATEGQTLTVMTWNIGYGALGDNADFFMDGGSSVMTASESRVNDNLYGISNQIAEIDPDILFLQEVDRDSTRSYHIDEESRITENFAMSDRGYSSTFANNFKTLFIPYPIPPIGKVDSGVLTLSRVGAESAERIALPSPFSWPVSMVNLKRCLNVTRVPIEGSDKMLVLINLHLEAYDDGEGKKAQTELLNQYMEAEVAAGNYVIAGGDFNQIFTSVDRSMYPTLEDKWQPGELDVNAFEDGFQFLMDTGAPTCRSLDQSLADASSVDPEDFQYYMLDGFIVSDNITVNSVETLDLKFRNTDHNPVVVNLTLNES